jgi:adenosylmethionine-8-amino-7-oxononanoate aminotransferase
LATLAIFDEDDVINRNRERAARLTDALAPLAQDARIANFRQRGMIWAFDVKVEAAGFARRFFTAALRRELLLRPIGRTVYLMPPYVLDDEESALLAERTLAVLNDVVPA